MHFLSRYPSLEAIYHRSRYSSVTSLPGRNLKQLAMTLSSCRFIWTRCPMHWIRTFFVVVFVLVSTMAAAQPDPTPQLDLGHRIEVAEEAWLAAIITEPLLVSLGAFPDWSDPDVELTSALRERLKLLNRKVFSNPGSGANTGSSNNRRPPNWSLCMPNSRGLQRLASARRSSTGRLA